MSIVLAIEPDRAHAATVREILHGRLGPQLLVVESKQQAIEAISREMPELILVSALFAPRDEDDVVAHLRTLGNASHLQLLTIPRLAQRRPAGSSNKSFFGFGKKQQAPVVPDGCDPEEFIEQVTSYLARARDVKQRPSAHAAAALAVRPLPADGQPVTIPVEPSVPVVVAEPAAAVSTGGPPVDELPVYHAPVYEAPFDDLPVHERLVAAPPVSDVLAEATEAPVAEGEIDRLLDRLGFGPNGADADIQIGDARPISESGAGGPEDAGFELASGETADWTSEEHRSVPDDAAATIELRDDLEPAVSEGDPIVLAWESHTGTTGIPATELMRDPISSEAARPIEANHRITELDIARIRAEAEAALADELDRVHTEAAERREQELARWQAEAEALREATVGRARAEAEAQAREAFDAELARARVASEQTRQDEIARLQAVADERLEEVTRQARQVAENEAARAFTEELARVRADAESAAARTLEEEVARVRTDSEARLQAELERVRRDAEEARRAEHAAARAEAERIRATATREAREVAEAAAARALAAEVQRVRAETEAVRAAAEARLAEHTKAHADASHAIAEAERIREAAAREAREIAEVTAARTLEAELQRVRAEADARLKEQTETQIEAEKIRDDAAREARRVADAAAAATLEAEIRRVKSEADGRLARELDALRADAEDRRKIELEEVRQQIEQMRHAAAEQARMAASEAVAAELARAASSRGAAVPPPKPVAVVRVGAAAPPSQHSSPAEPAPTPAAPFESRTPSSSYYDLWRSEGSPQITPPPPVTSTPSRFRRERWMLPAAAAALLVVCGTFGLSVSATAWSTGARKAIAAALPGGEATAATAPASPVLAATGDLLVETTPKGAAVSVDGTPRGHTPLTVQGLSPGRHTLLLESNDGIVIGREVTIRAGERAVSSELMVTGWLTVSSRVPVDVHVGGRRIGTSGHQLPLPPGRHRILFLNKEHNVRETRTIEIRAGAIVSHTLKLPEADPPDAPEVPVDSHGTEPPGSFDGLKVLSESAANPGMRKPRP